MKDIIYLHVQREVSCQKSSLSKAFGEWLSFAISRIFDADQNGLISKDEVGTWFQQSIIHQLSTTAPSDPGDQPCFSSLPPDAKKS